ncbi:MAG: type II toxin-antitoxin system Phd/YefM family antitoxin [Desulfonatronovibrio sp.]
MQTINIADNEIHLAHLIKSIESGEDEMIIIARQGKPIAKITPFSDNHMGQRIGSAKGKFEVPEDIDSDNELISQMFYKDNS